MLRVTSTDDGFSVRNRRAVLCAAPVWCPALFLRLPTPAVLLDMQGDTAKGSISLAVAAVAGVTVALAGAPSYVGRCLVFSDCVCNGSHTVLTAEQLRLLRVLCGRSAVQSPPHKPRVLYTCHRADACTPRAAAGLCADPRFRWLAASQGCSGWHEDNEEAGKCCIGSS